MTGVLNENVQKTPNIVPGTQKALKLVKCVWVLIGNSKIDLVYKTVIISWTIKNRVKFA